MPPRNPLPFLAGVATEVASNVKSRFASLRQAATAATRPRPRSDRRPWSAELLKQLEWRRFEELCVAYYETAGFAPELKRTADGSVDILLVAPGEERPDTLARCKAWDAYRIGSRPVRELVLAMRDAGVSKGVLLTAGRFTPEAAPLAATVGIELIDGAALLERIHALAPEQALALLEFATQGDYRTPTCPACNEKMVARQSTQGGRAFWGCRNYPRCKETLTSGL